MLFRSQALLLGGTNQLGWFQANAGRTKSDGVRQYSHQDLNNGFLRAGREFFGTQLTLLGLGLDMPTAQNPGAVTRVVYDTKADSADSLSKVKRARKLVRQVQLGLTAARPLRGGEVQAQAYGAGRHLFNPLTFAIVGIDRRTSGGSVRDLLPVNAFGLQNRFTFGVDAQRLSDARKNWTNCNAVTATRDRKSTRLNSSHIQKSRMPSSA